VNIGKEDLIEKYMYRLGNGTMIASVFEVLFLSDLMVFYPICFEGECIVIGLIGR